MKKTARKVASAVLVLVLLAVMFVPRAAVTIDATDSKTDSLQSQIDELEEKIAEYKAQIADLNSQKANKMEIKASLDALAEVTQQKITAAAELSKELDAEIATTTENIAAKEEEIAATFDKFLERLVVSYEQGDASYLSIIMNSDDLSDFLMKMDMVNSMLEYDRNLKIKYQNEKIELESDKKRLEEDLKYQEDLLKKLEEDKAEYEKLSKEQAEYIAALEKDISDANAAYEQAKAKENALDAELQQYLAELAEQQRQQAIAAQQGNGGGPYVGGNFIWPLYGYSYISSGFGWRTLNGYSDYHRGIDIPAPYGTPIHASKGGKVITATGHSSYGNYVVIDHGINSDGNGETTLYAHMSSIGCSVGQVVNQGDVIGYVGSTGYSTGNHTHFEVRINGTANNPLNFVSP